MAKITAQDIQIEFSDGSSVNLGMDEENNVAVIDQGDHIIWIPRGEVEQFASMLSNWAAEHPVSA